MYKKIPIKRYFLDSSQKMSNLEEFEDLVSEEKKIELSLESQKISFITSPHLIKELITGFLFLEKGKLLKNLGKIFQNPEKIEISEENLIPSPKNFLLSPQKRTDSFEKLKVSPLKILSIFKTIEQSLRFFPLTGSFHWISLVDLGNSCPIHIIVEDISRSGALYKLAGKIILEKFQPEKPLVLFSGRIYSELMKHFVRFGCKILITRGAPSFEAIKIAERHQITLIGFVRKNRFNVYSHPWRLEK